MSRSGNDPSLLTVPVLLRFWFPLAASWLLMSVEAPLVTAVVARMPGAKLQLAGFGIAISLALMVESPVISLLTAGNALATDRASYRLVYRFMLALSATTTAALLLLAFTPLFDLVVLRLIGAPSQVAVLVRRTLRVMIPWPAAIAYRRFYQGVMIRCGHTRQVSYGTVVRLLTTLAVAVTGYLWGRLDGAVVAGMALAGAVIAESACVRYLARQAVCRVRAEPVPAGGEALTVRALLTFYLPLALTSTIMLSATPILNSGLTRASFPVRSLAVWPVINGQLFILRSLGYSLQEVVVALLSRPASRRLLRRFTGILGLGSLALMLAFALTPLGAWWQQRVAGLSPELTSFAVPALRWAVLLPALAVVQSWLRGIIIVGQNTAAIAWATVINLLALIAVLWVGSRPGGLPGASLAAIALTVSQTVESIWLWSSVRSVGVRAAFSSVPGG